MYKKGIYQIVKVRDELSVISDLSELRFLIEGYLSQGITHIGVSFSDSSYLYSGAIAVLIDCFKKIKDSNGTLSIIEPNPEILGILKYLNITKLIPICTSEDTLPTELE